MAQVLNVSAYLFTRLDDTAQMRPVLRERALAAGLTGTIILAEEGINLFLAGDPARLRGFIDDLRSDPRFAALVTKESWSSRQPFGKMLVKLKREIIRMDHPTIRPADERAPAVTPETLRRWLDEGHDDDGREVVMLDTRNAFEVDYGGFDGALDWRIEKFTEFPDAVARHRDELVGKTVVSYCTGGIRCEKAAIHLREEGVDAWQLDGGILGWFENVGGAHYRGDLFVFDEREALGADLAPGGHVVTSRELSGDAVLREARPGDEAGILAMITALAVYEREPDAVVNTVAMLSETLFGAEPRAYAHVVERDGRIVGIAIWFLTYSTWTGRHGIWLEDLYVDEPERGRGYGRALMSALAAVCVARGYSRFEWTVLDWNAPSIAFYRSLGAVPMDEWTTQRLTGDELRALAER